MKTVFIIAVLALSSLGLVHKALAQGTEFTYQGRLLFGDVPANGNYDFEFALFDADAGGNQLGTTFPLSTVNVNNGVFSVRIDFGNQFPGANRFLEIHVRQTGSTAFAVLSPRQSISSAPYSIKSLNASSSDSAINALALGGVRANQFVVTNDRRLSDARDPLPNSSNYIQNTTAQQPITNFNISGDGTAGGTLSGNSVNSATRFTINGNSVLSVDGTSNTFAGITAGQSTMPATDGSGNGLKNSFFGNEAAKFSTTGSSNSFFGYQSGVFSTTGSSNSFFGNNAGQNNGAGRNNSYFGVAAGFGDFGTSSSGGSANSFFGSGAGGRNGIGNNNSALGAGANFTTSNLSFATAIGSFASVSSSDTIVLGKAAGNYGGISRPADNLFAPGTLNVGGAITVGDAATFHGVGVFGKNVTIGSSLVLGTDMSVGRGLTVGDTVTVQGVASFGSSVTIGGAVTTGVDVTVGRNLTVAGTLLTSNNLSTNTNLGVGTSAPAAKVDVSVNSGHILMGNAGCSPGFVGIGFGATLSGCNNYSLVGNGTDTIISRPAGGTLFLREANVNQMAITSGGFVGIGTIAPTSSLTVFNPNTARFDLLTSSPGNPSFGYSQTVRADGQWILSTNTGSSRIALDGNGFVAIGGTPTPAARLFVNGDLRASGSIFVGNLFPSGNQSVCLNSGFLASCSSSIRYKSDVQSFTPGLDLIKRLRPVSFTWKSDHTHDMGLVAEAVAKVEPLLVTRNEKGEAEGVKYDRVAVVLVNAVNEQQTQIETQQKQISAQSQTIQRQQAEIDALKSLVCSRNHSAKLCRTSR
jgi:hypothetical protein